ncbi:hypothetical protein IFM89_028005 [Coptis chinensis]|uniref:Protoporphyrinogen oxidase n=1 Tax=Coptis chinensis TaxID=261450 RepID=A0A835LT54_9MAGN|nr:hypothetical protein IFM89_028005 [Coptis chinensis]
MTSSSTTTATVKGREDSKTKLGSVKSVAVVGGGISGLAAAYKLKSNGLDVTLFEADERVGGKLKSVSRDGLIWDEGANTMIVGKKARKCVVIFNDIGSFGDEIGHELESEMEVTRILDNAGLRGKQQFPISANKRYIVRNGQPEILPTTFFGFMKSNFLSTKSKKMLFHWRRLMKIQSEANWLLLLCSVRDFFERHFGKEVVDYLIDPFVAGTSAADLDSLSVSIFFL